MLDYDIEQSYKNKIAELEKENRSLKSEYESEHRLQEHMAEQISAQNRIIKNRNTVIKKYIEKYGKLEED